MSVASFGPESANRTANIELTAAEAFRFARYVERAGEKECWSWIGASYGRYNAFQFRGYAELAHRIAYIIANGAIPPGMCVCHDCDNTKCVNPAHLILGTQKFNMRDMSAKMRARGGGLPQRRSRFANSPDLFDRPSLTKSFGKRKTETA